mmetsp:Transcript_30728/g.74884  ORF Transcript_30728/g.74884 Transcript_30728/m.74884 type:complete len:105 (+) Transcript_30728:619-933(+)
MKRIHKRISLYETKVNNSTIMNFDIITKNKNTSYLLLKDFKQFQVSVFLNESKNSGLVTNLNILSNISFDTNKLIFFPISQIDNLSNVLLSFKGQLYSMCSLLD